MRCQWLLCGRSRRWYDAACRFGPQTLPRSGDRLAIATVAPAQLRHACRQAQGSVILWPLDEAPDRAAFQTSIAMLAQLSDLEVPTLHLIVPPAAPRAVAARRGSAVGGGSGSSAVDLLELAGSAIVLEGPADLNRLVRLLRRFWERIRPLDEPLETLYLPIPPSA